MIQYSNVKAITSTGADGVDIIAKTYASAGNYQTIYVLWTDRELHIPCITFWRDMLGE